MKIKYVLEQDDKRPPRLDRPVGAVGLQRKLDALKASLAQFYPLHEETFTDRHYQRRLKVNVYVNPITNVYRIAWSVKDTGKKAQRVADWRVIEVGELEGNKRKEPLRWIANHIKQRRD